MIPLLRRLWPNAGLVARREYVQRVRSRAFVISTAVIAIVVFAAAQAPTALQALERGAPAKLAIVVQAPDLRIDPVGAAGVVLNSGALAGTGTAPYEIRLWTNLDAARAAVRVGDLRAVMVIGRAADGRLTFQTTANLSRSGTQATLLELAATWISISDGLQRAGIDPASGAGPFASFDITPANATAAPVPTEVQSVGNVILGTILIVLVFIMVMTYGMWIATSVAEEKSSRVMELMLSAATPIQMLTGKVIGVGAAGLTQYVTVLVTGLIALAIQGPLGRLLFGSSSSGPPIAGLTPGILVGFGLFFVLGFALYAFLYAAAGSLVSRQEDVQQVALPMILLTMTGYFAASFAVSSAEAGWVAPLSFVPFFSPYLMIVRLTVGHVGIGEILLSAAILSGTIAVAMWLAARIYTTGVLMYGQRPGIRTFLEAARRPSR